MEEKLNSLKNEREKQSSLVYSEVDFNPKANVELIKKVLFFVTSRPQLTNKKKSGFIVQLCCT